MKAICKKGFIFLVLFFSVLLPSVSLESSEKKEILSEKNIKKIKRLAIFLSNELKAKEITQIRYEEITDIKGRKTKRSRLLSDELRRQLKNNGMILRDDAVVSIKGILTRFRDDPKKYRLKVEVFNQDGSIITSYTGILRW